MSGVESSCAGSQGKSLAQPCGSHSPSRTSSRYSSGSPGDLRHHSRSRSWHADEDHQEEQSSLDFVSVVAHVWSFNELLEAPSENRKI